MLAETREKIFFSHEFSSTRKIFWQEISRIGANNDVSAYVLSVYGRSHVFFKTRPLNGKN
jgi:hypothetical protein